VETSAGSRTADDLMMSSIATMGVAETQSTPWDRELSARFNNLNDLETEMSQLFSQAEALDISQKRQKKKAKELFDRASKPAQCQQTKHKLTSSRESTCRRPGSSRDSPSCSASPLEAEQEIDSTTSTNADPMVSFVRYEQALVASAIFFD